MRYVKLTTTLALSISITFILCVSAATAIGQVPTATPTSTPVPISDTPSAAAETDPTRAMLFVLRNEYRDLKNGSWANIILLRHDRFSFRNLHVKGGGRGFVLRFDVPVGISHTGNNTKAGLGDIYTQLLLVPRISRRFALTVGTGLIVPTATSASLGQGKLTIAPLVVPLWYLARRKRLVLFRLQHYVSVAGNSTRPNVNSTVFDPQIGMAVKRKAWIFTNTEFKWDWRTKLGSGITGVQYARMVNERIGVWIKGEVPWGAGRQGGFNIKIGLFRFR